MAKWGGFFDFNGDGKESFFETAVAFKLFQEFMKEEEEVDDDLLLDELDTDDWRDWCDDADEYNLNPYDYDTLEDYEEALEEAKEDRDEEGLFAVDYGVEDYDMDEYDTDDYDIDDCDGDEW